MVLIKVRKNKEDIASVFIREFTRQLIINSKPQSNVDPKIIERVKQKLENKMNIELKPLRSIQVNSQTNNQIARRKIPISPMPNNRQVFQRSIAQIKPQVQPTMPVPVQKQIPAIKELSNTENTINLGKLSNIFTDPRITGIECPGPNKNILINKSGLVQPYNLTLNEQEIKSILNEFSTKTKIPLINGIFKALYNNILITAIISDIAGNRFIIEKHFGQLILPKKEQ